MEWNVEPIFLQIGPVALRYYSFMFLIGFLSMDFYVKKQFESKGKDPNAVSSLTNHIVFGMLIGARLAHCFFYDPGYYFSHILEIPMIWKGGLASHGGYLGVIIAVTLFLKKNKDLSFYWVMDIIAGPCALVGGLIRVGNFFNSEIVGKAASVPWAITFSRLDNIPRHPAQLYESIGYFTIAGILIWLTRKKFDELYRGTLLCWSLIMSFGYRFFIEFFKDNQSSVSKGLALNMGQFLSLAMVAASFFWWLRIRNINKAAKS
jgi:phosphatidylglycerol:prolipoprotein diacylglycerol transferase